MAARKLAAFLAAILHLCLCQNKQEVLPEFLQPLENHTVIQGREVSFTCVVNHLGSYKVAWIKSDSKAILAISTHMVAHNPRLSVTHNGHNTWKLHVSNVQKNDSGTYMCQVNTDPMRFQMGHMKVMISPDILDDESANGLITHEGGNVRLRCIATGSPEPKVIWKREDGRNIIRRENGKKESLPFYNGTILELTNVQRQEMGVYLCIASNSVPPSVSKRYSVDVNFAPVIKVANQLVAAPIHKSVVLQCYVEASPRAMNTWYRDPEEKLLPSSKHSMSEHALSDYSWQMNLTINMLQKSDFGSYVCLSENALGHTEGVVRLQEMEVPRTTPNTPRRKVAKARKTNSVTSRRPQNIYEIIDGPNDDDFGTTQITVGSTLVEAQRTERPIVLPSLTPPWISMSSANSRQNSISKNAILILSFFLSSTAFAF
ncbi:lachesin-like [Prorops nasuta]|uniref:lachesin-like n=1 Tax=Prorops nasuta TaxID=863751 RepID=UPI0034CE4D14